MIRFSAKLHNIPHTAIAGRRIFYPDIPDLLSHSPPVLHAAVSLLMRACMMALIQKQKCTDSNLSSDRKEYFLSFVGIRNYMDRIKMCASRCPNPLKLCTFAAETRNVDRFGLIATTIKNAKKGKVKRFTTHLCLHLFPCLLIVQL